MYRAACQRLPRSIARLLFLARLTVAAITLAGLRNRLGPPPLILGQRTAHVIRFLDPSYGVTPDVALVTARSDQLTLFGDFAFMVVLFRPGLSLEHTAGTGGSD